jgi:hypothetical protein
MIKYTILGLFALALILNSCGPSVNPAYQQKIGTFYGKSLDKTYPSSAKFSRPMSLAVGQWVLWGLSSDGKRSISKSSIVGKEGDGWIIEAYSLSDYDESTIQYLVRGIEKVSEKGNIDDIEMVWMKIRDKDGNITTQEGVALTFSKGFYKKALEHFAVNITGSDGGTVKVPAGNFPGTTKYRSEVTFFGTYYESDGWYHSEVPISGMIKSVSTDNKITMELLDFGKTGATKSF